MEWSFREYLLLETGDYPQKYTFGVEIEVPFEDYENKNIETILRGMRLNWSFNHDQTCIPGIEMKTPPYPITDEILNILKSDLTLFNQGVARMGINIRKSPSKCATHFHIGGLSNETKVKVAKIWIDGGVQDMETALINPERRELLDAPQGTYMRRVNSINQYQTLPHYVPSNGLSRFIQKIVTHLKNMLALDKAMGYDKFYSMSPRGGLGTLEFRTKESTTDGHEIVILVKSIAALCSAADSLYNRLRSGGKLDTSDVRRAMYSGGVHGKDLAYVMRRAQR